MAPEFNRRALIGGAMIAMSGLVGQQAEAEPAGDDDTPGTPGAGDVVGTELPAAPGLKVATLTPAPGFRNEPSVAINPANPTQALVAFQLGPRTGYSADGGQSWKFGEATVIPSYKEGADVSVAYDDKGQAFIAHLAFDGLGTSQYWAHNATRHGLFVWRSTDGGVTWEAPPVPVVEHRSEPGIPFEDKPYIVADATRSAYAGHLYLGWTRFTLEKSVILISRSIDSGQTWSEPAQISSQDGGPRDDTGAVEGFTGAIGNDGALYVAWSRGAQIMFATSRDGGLTFIPSRPIIETTASFFDVAGIARANGFPTIAIDPSSDTLFVSWADYRNGDLDVLLSRSMDRGNHWSDPVRVNTDPIHNGADQFFPWLSVDRIDHSINLIFYDRRSDPNNKQCGVTLARSIDAGHTFSNYRLSAKTFEPQGDFLGDYLAVSAYNGLVYGAWSRTATAEEIQSNSNEAAKSKVNVMVDVCVADFRQQ